MLSLANQLERQGEEAFLRRGSWTFGVQVTSSVTGHEMDSKPRRKWDSVDELIR